MEKIIVYAFPLFGLMILLEYAWGLAKNKNTYRINDAISNLSQGVLSQITLVFTGIFQIGIYTLTYNSLGIQYGKAFWGTGYGWLTAIILVDFFGYWHHRLSHETGLLWAAHAVHHQSQEFNFSTALRQESAYPILGWVFYLPMALLGVPPKIFALTALVVLLYQIWIHTEHIGKLGWFDRVFSSPSNHRVHHAVNDNYIDKNYGNMLVIWDRIFGTFTDETEEKCIYGTRPPLNSWDPIYANLVVYLNLYKDATHASSWKDKLKIWFMPPGWRPADVIARYPEIAFDPSTVKQYNPPIHSGKLWFSGLQFFILLVAVGLLLWHLNDLTFSVSAILVLDLIFAYWGIGRVLEGRITISNALILEATALFFALLVLYFRT